MFVADPGGGYWPYLPSQIRRVLRSSSNLKDFAKRFSIDTRQSRTLLERADVDYVWFLHKQYLLGMTCAEIAQKNGMKLRTLTRLFKEADIAVSRGPRQHRLPTKKLKRIWKTCDNIINRFAIALDIRWATAKKVLESIYLAPWERPSRTLSAVLHRNPGKCANAVLCG